MHLFVSLITLAENEEDAKLNTSIFIDEYAGREFFDYGSPVEDEPVVLASEIKDILEKEKAETIERLVPEYERMISEHKNSGNIHSEGYYHIQLGKILCEYCCHDMPFFNITDWNWKIPTEVPEEAKGCNWYAVRVDLHC